MAVAGGVAQYLLVVLGKQLQGIGFVQVAVLAQGKHPAGTGVLAGLVTQRTVVESGGLELEVLVDQCQGVVKTGVDRKSTRLNSSHVRISYAAFCWKKKRSIAM